VDIIIYEFYRDRFNLTFIGFFEFYFGHAAND